MSLSSVVHVLRRVLVCGLGVLLGGVSAQADGPTDVFLLIGQSNMSGRAQMLEGDDAAIEGVQLLNDRGEWEAARQPLNRYSTDRHDLPMQRFNLSGSFALSLRDTCPDVVPGLIVNARGGTKIEWWQPGEDLYEHALGRVRALEGVRLAGVLWHQGEGNAQDEQYAEKLEAVIAGIRSDLDQPDLPFIAGHISGENVINPLMDALVQRVPYMRVISVDGLNPTDSDGHYDRDGMILLGRRYAEAYKSLVTELEAAKELKKESGEPGSNPGPD
jgi:carbohydrate esterase-like sialic acid-specific acetylesterase